MLDSSVESRYVDVLDSSMHYVEMGEGEPILLLHGNPTSSFIWRNIMPELATLGRCIAPDLIGMGKSGKPDIEYRFFDHSRYLEEFVHTLKLRNVAIVGHDWGGALGFQYGMHHERNVRALAFFETIVKPLTWGDFPSDFRFALRLFRTPVLGQLLVQGLNLFIRRVLARGVADSLEPEVRETYAAPFGTYGSRKPLLRMPNDLPIDGNPSDINELAERWAAWLGRSDVPKLLLYASPGALVKDAEIAWCKANVKNLETKSVGHGVHYLQEDQPDAVCSAIVEWMKSEVIQTADVSR